ncbi:MAG TPA: hypothetical protein VH481_03930 [Nitrososphaeraceae archaeon]
MDDTVKSDEDTEDLKYMNSDEGKLARLVQSCEAIITSEAFDFVALFSTINVTTPIRSLPHLRVLNIGLLAIHRRILIREHLGNQVVVSKFRIF